jgi:hypothetical protein
MLDFQEFMKLGDAKLGDSSEPDFQCDFCEQRYSHFTFQLAVFLYGIALLKGKEEGYAIFTCPSCLKSNIIKNVAIDIIYDSQNIFYLDSNAIWSTPLSYFSSTNLPISSFPGLEKSDILLWVDDSNDSDDNSYSDIFEKFLSKNKWIYEAGYLSSFQPGHGKPMGLFVSVWFIQADEIQKVVSLENEHEIRYLPRYYHEMPFFNDFDLLSYSDDLYQRFINELRMVEDRINAARKRNIQSQGVNFGMVDKDWRNPHKMAHERGPDDNYFIIQYSTNDDAFVIDRDAHFLKLLLSNPEPWGVPVPTNYSTLFKNLWQTDLPFEDGRLPFVYTDIDFNSFASKEVERRHEKIHDFISENRISPAVPKFLSARLPDFIDQYIEIARRNDFSYGSLWQLKRAFVKDLYQEIQNSEDTGVQYAFYSEGPTWTITFDGITIRGLRGIGFKYLHFLVTYQNNSYFPEDLDQLNGIELEHIKEHPEIKQSSDAIKGASDLSKVSKPKAHHADKIVGESINHLHREYDRLKQEKEKAEADGDPLLLKEAETKFDEFSEYYYQYFTKGKKIKKFKQKELKIIKDRIAISIKRALERIKRTNTVIWEHFNKSLAPPYSNELYYRPIEEIEWRCK